MICFLSFLTLSWSIAVLHVEGTDYSPQDDSAVFTFDECLMISGGKQRVHPEMNPAAVSEFNIPDTPLNVTTSIRLSEDCSSSAEVTQVDHGRLIGWRAEHTCFWAPDATNNDRLMCIGGYEDGAHLSNRLRINSVPGTDDSLYKQDLREYVRGIGWVKWRIEGGIHRPGCQYWVCKLDGAIYCGGGYGNLQPMEGGGKYAMPVLFSDVFEIKLGEGGGDRVQSCINLLKRTNESHTLVHAATIIEEWVTAKGSTASSVPLNGYNADGTQMKRPVQGDKVITLKQWTLLWTALARALAETRVVTDPDSTVFKRGVAVHSLSKVFSSVTEVFIYGKEKGFGQPSDAQVLEHIEGLEKLVVHLARAYDKGGKESWLAQCSSQSIGSADMARTLNVMTRRSLDSIVHGLGVVSSFCMTLRPRRTLLRTLAALLKNPNSSIFLVYASWRILANVASPSDAGALSGEYPAGGIAAFSAVPRFYLIDLEIIPILWKLLSAPGNARFARPIRSMGNSPEDMEAYIHSLAIIAALRLFANMAMHPFCHEELNKYVNPFVFERLAQSDTFRDDLAKLMVSVKSQTRPPRICSRCCRCSGPCGNPVLCADARCADDVITFKGRATFVAVRGGGRARFCVAEHNASCVEPSYSGCVD